ncbi:hypothetical protein [Nostoc sp. DedQUE07]|uniref:hypothetical protein n=1 Tax=Nostoc sp. DedQUE07 TaxID=3075392 RepID=UPI002AD3C72C|nr:hypothetical protein [Nostoc sp. DedQUE07]MDZ8131980.1 hypothetical protein [Nostoc sp. DedQUE07]
MARLEFSGTRNTAPRWMGDFGDRQSLLPGGVRVNKFKFAESNGIRQISSGVLLGRRANATHWEPVNNNLNTTLSTTLTAAVASGGTILPVASTSGYRAGDVLTIATVDYTIAAGGVNDLNRTLTLTAGLSASAASGVAVALKTAVAHDDFYLLAYDIDDANRNADATLYRHQALVYFNYLPDYPFTSLANVLAKIKELYQTVMGG